MKKRTKGFLSVKSIDHDSEIFDYICELHRELWQFVRIAYPEASGSLQDVIESAKEVLKDESEKAWRYDGLCK